MWREVIGRPTIPYGLKQRREELAEAFRKSSDEVAAWEEVLKADAAKKAKLKGSSKGGSYPMFLNQQEVKSFLKQHGVARKVQVRRAGKWWTRIRNETAF